VIYARARLFCLRLLSASLWHETDMAGPGRKCLVLGEKWKSDFGVGRSESDPERIYTGSHCLRPEQCLVVRFYGTVAFADGLLQPFDIGDLNMAPRIFYHSSLLKRPCM
jgi:hypothetical protein